MDIFVEQIIKKRLGPKDYAIITATLLVGLTLTCLSIFILAFAFIIWVLVCVGVYYLITSRSLEFEYSITNGDITIDKIINRRKRKRVISIDAHQIEEMGQFKPELLRNKSQYKKFFASEYDDGRNSWYFCARSSKEGNVLVVFNPEEKVLNAIKPFIPRQVAFVAFGRK
ncbi:MAG TPA: DUF6106 family protein [Caproicibacter sp.]|nr:DUF6106 family protein [Caproicibacter sp.]